MCHFHFQTKLFLTRVSARTPSNRPNKKREKTAATNPGEIHFTRFHAARCYSAPLSLSLSNSCFFNWQTLFTNEMLLGKWGALRRPPRESAASTSYIGELGLYSFLYCNGELMFCVGDVIVLYNAQDWAFQNWTYTELKSTYLTRWNMKMYHQYHCEFRKYLQIPNKLIIFLI